MIEYKLVQATAVRIPESTYEADLFKNSYDYRPGKEAWEAFDYLRMKVNLSGVPRAGPIITPRVSSHPEMRPQLLSACEFLSSDIQVCHSF